MNKYLISLVLLSCIAQYTCSQKEPPKIDLHVHLTGKYAKTPALRYEKAAALSRQMNVIFGIAEEIDTPDKDRNDNTVKEMITQVKKYPLYLGLQVNQPGWSNLYSKEAINSVDYIMADALRFPDKDRKVRLLWIPDVDFNDREDFMDRYVEYHLKVFSEPINIWVNPTFLPESFQNQYDILWTEKRMKTLIDAVVQKNIAIEINSRYKIPGIKFIRMAKAAGAHFTYGSNQHDTGIGEIDWSVKMAKDCGLTEKDFFVPKRKLTGK